MILTIGYAKLTPDELDGIARDLRATVLDVRSRPEGPRVKRGFRRSELAARLGSAYEHRPELGGKAREYESADLGPLVERGARENLLLLCMEDDPCTCHRHAIAGRIYMEHEVAVGHIYGPGDNLVIFPEVDASFPAGEGIVPVDDERSFGTDVEDVTTIAVGLRELAELCSKPETNLLEVHARELARGEEG